MRALATCIALSEATIIYISTMHGTLAHVCALVCIQVGRSQQIKSRYQVRLKPLVFRIDLRITTLCQV